MTDLRAHLDAAPARLTACAMSIRVLSVNRRALEILGAADFADLVRNLPVILRDDALPAYMSELLQLWEGKTAFHTKSINYALDGRRIDIRLNGVILPGHEDDWSRVIVSIEDITPEEEARRRLVLSETYARSLFDDSPASLWVEDFSAIKALLDSLRSRGITDFLTFIDVHPEFVERCMQEVHVIDVNRHTLKLFRAPDKTTLLSRLGDVLREEMRAHFSNQLNDLWQGHLRHEREVLNYTLAGEPLNLILQFSVVPGYEHDWGKVLVALTDITARKKAEAYLEYLGNHDVLTGLYNRAFFVDEIHRLDRKGPFPVSVILMDLNGLKALNDNFGHAAGDAVLRRAGEILAQTVDRPGCVARIGGDEFVILLPSTGAAAAQTVLDNLMKLTELNNQYHSTATPVRFSVGCATCEAGERMEPTIQRADMLMYQSKRAYYDSMNQNFSTAE
ncbi:MAG TPA: sensor domain-containing diguanylate cyclase [Rhodopila sp.]|nr:sensor domain-containing diguanylate cyclase [Rhodopila sp.]